MSNESNLSSAKTVAGENSNEIINEQAEVAQVSNSNESIAMNTANSQSSMAPQVGTNEKALGSRAEDTTVEFVNEYADAAQVSTIACAEMETESPVMTPRLPDQVLFRPI